MSNFTKNTFFKLQNMDDDDIFTCRVQYINDADPFATTSSSYLEPMRPVTFNFR